MSMILLLESPCSSLPAGKIPVWVYYQLILSLTHSPSSYLPYGKQLCLSFIINAQCKVQMYLKCNQNSYWLRHKYITNIKNNSWLLSLQSNWTMPGKEIGVSAKMVVYKMVTTAWEHWMLLLMPSLWHASVGLLSSRVTIGRSDPIWNGSILLVGASSTRFLFPEEILMDVEVGEQDEHADHEGGQKHLSPAREVAV